MLVACWSAKGGAGTTVVATALAALLARSAPSGALLVDLGGDAPAVLGAVEPCDGGVAEWLSAGVDLDAGGLALLEVPLRDGLMLLPRGSGPLESCGRAEVFSAQLAADPRPVVVDCGVLTPAGFGGDDLRLVVASTASLSLLVSRACYLSVRRALAVPVRPSGVVLLTEPGRSLTADDVEVVLGTPVRAEIAFDPAIARAVDAGTFLDRIPRTLARALHAAA